jgi:Flp pilus assembly protein TadB
MWGNWFTVMSAGALLLLLVIASAFLGSPLLALLIAALGLVVLGFVYALRRSATRGAASPASAQSENPLTNPRRPASGGAPVAGEGSEPRDPG